MTDRSPFRLAALLAAGFAASACGFQPVYGGGSAIDRASAPVTILEIGGREGQALRKALLTELSPGLPGGAGGVLAVDLEREIQPLAFRPDGASARSAILLTADYELDRGTQFAEEERYVRGLVTSRTAFNSPDAPYAEIAIQRDTAVRAADALATQLVFDMIAKLGDAPAG